MPSDSSFDAAKTLQAIKTHLRKHAHHRVDEEVRRIPHDRLAAFAIRYVYVLHENETLLEAAAQGVSEIPLAEALTSLERLARKKSPEPLPGANLLLLRFLRHADLSDEGYLASCLPNLPPYLRRAFWYQRGSPPESIISECLEVLPRHALSGKMESYQLGAIKDALGIGDQLIEPMLALFRESDDAIPLPSCGYPLNHVPLPQLRRYTKRLDLARCSGHYLAWWIASRRSVLGESLEDSIEVLKIASTRLKKAKDRTRLAVTLEQASLDIAQACASEGLQAPRRLADWITPNTHFLKDWLPILLAFDDGDAASVLDHLQKTLADYAQGQLLPLRVRVEGPSALAPALAEFEQRVQVYSGVTVRHLIDPLGSLGAPIIPLLTKRIQELSTRFPADTYSSGYKPRRVVIALRNALAVALATQPENLSEDHVSLALDPAPRDLFEGSDDFCYSFFDGLNSAAELFRALPAERVRAWIDAWRESELSAFLDERLKRALPEACAHLLDDTPSLVAQVEALAAKTGRKRTLPIVLLSRDPDERETLSRVGMELHGFPQDRWPGEKSPYDPVLTLDLEELPELKTHYPANARVIALFVDNAEDGFRKSAVIALTAEEVAGGIHGGAPLRLERVVVPPRDREGDQQVMKVLWRRIGESPGRALAPPTFIQEPPRDWIHPIILQAKTPLVDLNLGDCGTLYVTPYDAFWQCY